MLSFLTDTVINAATVGFGLLSIPVRPIRRWFRRRSGFAGKCWNSPKTISDFLNGAAAVPFACLAVSVFDENAAAVVLGNKATVLIAGVIGLIFILGEICTAGRDD